MQHRNLQSLTGEGQLWVTHGRFVQEQRRAQLAEARARSLESLVRGIPARSEPTDEQLVTAIVAGSLLLLTSLGGVVAAALVSRIARRNGLSMMGLPARRTT